MSAPSYSKIARYQKAASQAKNQLEPHSTATHKSKHTIEAGKATSKTARKNALSILKHAFFSVVKVSVFAAHLFTAEETQAMGKKYSEQGRKLTAAMNSALLTSGICASPRQCYDLLPGTLETDTKILIHLYQINEQNKTAFATVVALALANGILITDGVPITIKAFRETQHEYSQSGLLIKEIKPFATIEVIK